MLQATPEQIRLDLELDLALRGEDALECPRCHGFTYAEACPCSPLVPVDAVEAAKARGDVTMDDFDRLWNESVGAASRSN